MDSEAFDCIADDLPPGTDIVDTVAGVPIVGLIGDAPLVGYTGDEDLYEGFTGE